MFSNASLVRDSVNYSLVKGSLCAFEAAVGDRYVDGNEVSVKPLGDRSGNSIFMKVRKSRNRRCPFSSAGTLNQFLFNFKRRKLGVFKKKGKFVGKGSSEPTISSILVDKGVLVSVQMNHNGNCIQAAGNSQ